LRNIEEQSCPQPLGRSVKWPDASAHRLSADFRTQLLLGFYPHPPPIVPLPLRQPTSRFCSLRFIRLCDPMRPSSALDDPPENQGMSLWRAEKPRSTLADKGLRTTEHGYAPPISACVGLSPKAPFYDTPNLGSQNSRRPRC